MELVIDVEPELGASYDDLMTLAQAVERLGFHGFFLADHYLMGEQKLPGPTDAWTTIAGLARDTKRLRLGTLVSPVTFRRPGPLAVAVAQIDAMSGGRVELGLGAGHGELEHRAYGIPFYDVGGRFDRLEEQLEIIRGLWTTPVGETYSFNGKIYQLADCPALPKPVQQPCPPIVVGGRGPKRTPRLAATFADELNVSYVPPPVAREAFGRAQEACEAIGRDPASLRLSTTALLCCGRDERELAQRSQRLLARRQPVAPPAEENKNLSYWKSYPGFSDVAGFAAVGTPDVLVERLLAYRDAGASRVYLHVYDVADIEHFELVATQVMPHLV
jgi:F420-dependent oxidoreductase-like protein